MVKLPYGYLNCILIEIFPGFRSINIYLTNKILLNCINVFYPSNSEIWQTIILKV